MTYKERMFVIGLMFFSALIIQSCADMFTKNVKSIKGSFFNQLDNQQDYVKCTWEVVGIDGDRHYIKDKNLDEIIASLSEYLATSHDEVLAPTAGMIEKAGQAPGIVVRLRLLYIEGDNIGLKIVIYKNVPGSEAHYWANYREVKYDNGKLIIVRENIPEEEAVTKRIKYMNMKPR